MFWLNLYGTVLARRFDAHNSARETPFFCLYFVSFALAVDLFPYIQCIWLHVKLLN